MPSGIRRLSCRTMLGRIYVRVFYSSNSKRMAQPARVRGEVTIRPYLKAASTAFTFGDIVTKDASGYLVKAAATTPRANLLGQIQRTIASTDSDYASNSLVNVEVFEHDPGEFKMTVDTGTLTQAMVGKQFDLADHNGIDVTSNAIGHVTIVRYVDASTAIVKFNLEGRTNFVMKSYQQVITYSQFTDGGGTSGTKALNVTIPAGCVYLQTLVSALTGFTGDTSAAFIIGDGSDTDRYNTGTPSAFTTAAAGLDAGVPSGTKFHSADKTPTVTITSNADFTNVAAGQMTITMVWLEPVA